MKCFIDFLKNLQAKKMWKIIRFKVKNQLLLHLNKKVKKISKLTLLNKVNKIMIKQNKVQQLKVQVDNENNKLQMKMKKIRVQHFLKSKINQIGCC